MRRDALRRCTGIDRRKMGHGSGALPCSTSRTASWRLTQDIHVVARRKARAARSEPGERLTHNVSHNVIISLLHTSMATPCHGHGQTSQRNAHRHTAQRAEALSTHTHRFRAGSGVAVARRRRDTHGPPLRQRTGHLVSFTPARGAAAPCRASPRPPRCTRRGTCRACASCSLAYRSDSDAWKAQRLIYQKTIWTIRTNRTKQELFNFGFEKSIRCRTLGKCQLCIK